MRSKSIFIIFCLTFIGLVSKAEPLKPVKSLTDSTKLYYQYTYLSSNAISEEFISTADGKVNRVTRYLYPRDYWSGSGTPMIDSLINNRLFSLPLETVVLDHDSIVGGQISLYYPSGKALMREQLALVRPVNGFTSEFGYSNLNSLSTPQHLTDGISPDLRYEKRVTYDVYDGMGNLLQSTATNGITSCSVWGYNNRYVIAEVSNVAITDVAYSSFERRAKGNWTFSGTCSGDVTSPVGEQCYNLAGGNITKTGLSNSKTFQLSYWEKSGATVSVTGIGITFIKTITGRTLDGWSLITKYLTTSSGSITISGTGYIDDLRLHPKEAMMSSTAFKPLVGIITKADARGNTLYYDYDGFQRLKYERDMNRNIIKSYSYNQKQY
ncbi:hypothetical protein [Pedobacter frigoris]|uniref:YD repeat-containing protein n=1 Tax=Pedobacter frigoris TaxID=2571272 RepID=A0A4U1CD45_9SPHI|nr:hypothetical protein [Pedobacter frigoris]TKC03992.1 hypothetical protein FA047_18795 [Pedobacter frigoris]